MTRGTTRRSIRMDDDLWTEFQAATKTAGVNASETIRGLIQEWLNTNQGEK
jgi:metal-responsive CopG/Arc/MetJ family transcriptional regulator